MVEEPFEWDEANISHLARHGITPAEAEHVVRNEPLQMQVELRSGELRRRELGITRDNKLLVVITTARGYNIRVVTAWPADRMVRGLWSTRRKVQS